MTIVQWFGGGGLAGIVLFFVLERTGVLHRWFGL